MSPANGACVHFASSPGGTTSVWPAKTRCGAPRADARVEIVDVVVARLGERHALDRKAGRLRAHSRDRPARRPPPASPTDSAADRGRWRRDRRASSATLLRRPASFEDFVGRVPRRPRSYAEPDERCRPLIATDARSRGFPCRCRTGAAAVTTQNVQQAPGRTSAIKRRQRSSMLFSLEGQRQIYRRRARRLSRSSGENKPYFFDHRRPCLRFDNRVPAHHRWWRARLAASSSQRA